MAYRRQMIDMESHHVHVTGALSLAVRDSAQNAALARATDYASLIPSPSPRPCRRCPPAKDVNRNSYGYFSYYIDQ